MLTTIGILDMLKTHLGSDYKAAKALDIHPNRISQLRHKGGVFTDSQAMRAAEILGYSGESFILSMAAERSRQTPEFAALARLADQFAPKIAQASMAILAICYFVPI